MELDLSSCQIHTPSGEALERLYQMLIEVFPVDRPVLTEMIATGKSFYTWTPYALYSGDELLANVSLVPMRIWLGARPLEVVGVASVATRATYRRKGIATYLLQHCLAMVDEERYPAVLFTGLPEFYRRFGFQAIPQQYLGVAADRLPDHTDAQAVEVVKRLDQCQLEVMSGIYSDHYPDYDGKVIRDGRYWQLYQMLLGNAPGVRIAFCRRHGGVAGYARLEQENNRLLVSELCGYGAVTGVIQTLLGFIALDARQAGLEPVSFALPPNHFALEHLRQHGVVLPHEPAGSHRETFMVRPAADRQLAELSGLQWSLADKF